MPYPHNSRKQDRSTDPSMICPNQTVLTEYNRLREAWNRGYPTYLSSRHAQELRRIFSQPVDMWTIDTILIAGLGYPPIFKIEQVMMIMYLAQLFDHITNQPLGFVQMHAQDDRRIALDEGLSPLICTACEMFIRSLGINHFQAQIDNFELPAKNYISPTTLLFTPYLDAQVLFRLLDQTDPELVINVAIDKYQYALGMSNTDFQRIKGAFLNSHLGENAPVYDKQCCDAGHLSALCIYRRRAGLKNDRTWTSNALGNTTAPKPTNWDRLCPRHEAERIANEQAAIIDRNLHRARNRGHDNDDNSGNKSGSVDSGDYESGSGDEEEDEDEDEEFEEDDGDFYEDD